MEFEGATTGRTGTSSTPLGPHLRDDERLYHLLTNRRTGVGRGGDRDAVRPGDDAGAYLGVTDSRMLALVADPVGRDHDYVVSHRYPNVTAVTVATESLTACVEFETADGRRWSFAAREPDIEPARRFLSAACTDASFPERAVLETHCRALSAHLEGGEWTVFDDRATAALDAVETFSHDAGTAPRDGTALGTLPSDLHRLVRDRHVLAGREQLASARPRLEAGDLELAYRRARTAYDEFEHAIDRARRAGLATENAIVGLTMADDIADTSLGRLLATGRQRYARAADRDDREARIGDLEGALEIYGTVGALVTGDETLSDAAKTRAQEEATEAIEALLSTRLDAAADTRQAADWERAVGNHGAARELAEDAEADLERALELATSYPPGDADEIRARLDSLRASLDAGREDGV